MESTKHFLKEQFRKLTLKANAPSDSVAIAAWSGIASKLVDSYGEDKFATAVQKWLEQEQFFPANPNDLRKYLPSAQVETCPRCRMSEGWLFRDYEGPAGTVKNAAYRCKHYGAAL